MLSCFLDRLPSSCERARLGLVYGPSFDLVGVIFAEKEKVCAGSKKKHRLIAEESAVPMVTLEGLEETRRFFAEADAVVGPHGAGLFNAPLFSR